MSYMNDWLNEDEEYEDVKISNVFNWGDVTTTTPTDDYKGEWDTIIAALSSASLEIVFGPYEITEVFPNTYYREGIGDRLFVSSNLNGADGLGTNLVKTVIKSKTAAEFASAEMAALLNNGRRGANAPWEYVPGALYPTLKTTIEESGGETPVDITENIFAGVDIVTVSEGAMKTAVENAEANGSETVKIEAAKGYDVYAVKAQIPVAGLGAVAGSDVVQNIMIASPVGDITLDADAIEDLITDTGNSASVEIIVERKGEDYAGLTEAQKTALKGRNARGVYDVRIAIGGNAIEFSTGGALTIGLPCALRPGETGERVRVLYVGGDGSVETMNVIEYREGKALFNTNHLSLYATAYEETAPASGGGSGGGCDAGLGLFPLAGLIGIGAFLLRKREK
jgi:hypothetical protein